MKRGFGRNGQFSLEFVIVVAVALVALGIFSLLVDDSVQSNQTVSVQNQVRQLAVQTSQKLSGLTLLQNYSSAQAAIPTQKIRALQTHYNETCTILIQKKNPGSAMDGNVTVSFDPDGATGNAPDINSAVSFVVSQGIQNKLPANFSTDCGKTITAAITTATITLSAS